MRAVWVGLIVSGTEEKDGWKGIGPVKSLIMVKIGIMRTFSRGWWHDRIRG